MDTAIINFKIEKGVKKEAQRIAKQMGLNLTDIMNVCLRDFVKRKELNIRIEDPTNQAAKEIAIALQEIKEGKTSPLFNSAGEAAKWLDNESKKYAN